MLLVERDRARAALAASEAFVAELRTRKLYTVTPAAKGSRRGIVLAADPGRAIQTVAAELGIGPGDIANVAMAYDVVLL